MLVPLLDGKKHPSTEANKWEKSTFKILICLQSIILFRGAKTSLFCFISVAWHYNSSMAICEGEGFFVHLCSASFGHFNQPIV